MCARWTGPRLRPKRSPESLGAARAACKADRRRRRLTRRRIRAFSSKGSRSRSRSRIRAFQSKGSPPPGTCPVLRVGTTTRPSLHVSFNPCILHFATAIRLYLRAPCEFVLRDRPWTVCVSTVCEPSSIEVHHIEWRFVLRVAPVAQSASLESARASTPSSPRGEPLA